MTTSLNNRTLIPVGREDGTSAAPTPPVRARVSREEGPASECAEAWGDDYAEWRVRLKELFATLSPDFVDASMRQLLKLAVLPGHGVATSTSLSRGAGLNRQPRPSR